MEEMHQQKVEKMIKQRRRQCWTSPQINEANNVEWRSADTEERQEDARLLDRCEAIWKDWAKHWQCDVSVQNVEDKPWENEELKKLGGSLTKSERR